MVGQRRNKLGLRRIGRRRCGQPQGRVVASGGVHGEILDQAIEPLVVVHDSDWCNMQRDAQVGTLVERVALHVELCNMSQGRIAVPRNGGGGAGNHVWIYIVRRALINHVQRDEAVFSTPRFRSQKYVREAIERQRGDCLVGGIDNGNAHACQRE